MRARKTSRTYVRGPLAARFWVKVEVGKDHECWTWKGCTLSARPGSLPYGMIGRDGGKSMMLAHRASYELHFGPVPAGLHVLHKCDNPRCVNPSHLFVGTHTDNMRDMVAKGRARPFNASKTHCPLGHEYTPENTRTSRQTRSGGIMRACRECQRIRQRCARRLKEAFGAGGDGNAMR